MSRRRVGVPVLVAVAVALLALPVGVGAQETAPRRVPLGEFTPLPADPSVSPEARALRDELLGDHWDDPEHVTLHWTGVSSFIITIRGHLLLFDAWEIIGAVDDYLPIGREELAGIEPEAVLVGHGHFDHAGDLGYVAGSSGAVVVGSEEICTVAEQGAVREGVGTDFTCAITGTMDTPPPGTAQTLQLFEDVEPVTILQHVHSAATPPGEHNHPDPFFPIMDPQPYLDHFADDPEELQRFLAQQEESNQGGTWLYHLKDGDFTLLVGDSAGPIFDYPEVVAALDAFPGCVDVMSNAILGFDQPVSGLQDPRLYVQHAHPKLFVPTHADAWAPVISAGQAQYVDEFESQMELLEHPPELDFLIDPDDYLVERAYHVDDPRWVTPMPGSSCASAAGDDAPPGSEDGGSTAGSTDEGGRAPTPVTGGGLAGLALITLALVLGLRRLR